MKLTNEQISKLTETLSDLAEAAASDEAARHHADPGDSMAGSIWWARDKLKEVLTEIFG